MALFFRFPSDSQKYILFFSRVPHTSQHQNQHSPQRHVIVHSASVVPRSSCWPCLQHGWRGWSCRCGLIKSLYNWLGSIVLYIQQVAGVLVTPHLVNLSFAKMYINEKGVLLYLLQHITSLAVLHKHPPPQPHCGGRALLQAHHTRKTTILSTCLHQMMICVSRSVKMNGWRVLLVNLGGCYHFKTPDI